jgi:hypothetical protein
MVFPRSQVPSSMYVLLIIKQIYDLIGQMARKDLTLIEFNTFTVIGTQKTQISRSGMATATRRTLDIVLIEDSANHAVITRPFFTAAMMVKESDNQ